MEKDETQELELVMHRMHEDGKIMARARADQAIDRAVTRCMARADVMKVVIRKDGSLLCTDYDGRETLRLAGWRGRT